MSRRGFLHGIGTAGALLGAGGLATRVIAIEGPTDETGKIISGFEKTETDPDASANWQPFSDRKVRVGIAGYGICKFGAQFGFQDHPNVEVVADTDLTPDHCAGLAKSCRCEKTYPSCEEMLKDDAIEAVFIHRHHRREFHRGLMHGRAEHRPAP